MPKLHIDEVYTKDNIHPMIINFQNGYTTSNFRPTRCLLLQNEKTNKTSVATELNDFIYASEEENEDLGMTMILARNKSTGKVRLIEVSTAVEDISKNITDHDDRNFKGKLEKKISVNNKDKCKRLIKRSNALKKNKTKSSSNIIKPEYKCDECNNFFSSKQILNKHIFQCVKIKTNPTNKTLSGNSEAEIPTKSAEIYNCDICPIKTREERYIVSNLKTHDENKVHSNNLCDSATVNDVSLIKNKTTYTEEKQKNDLKSSNINGPMIPHSSGKSYPCSFCHYSSSKRSNLESHIRTHTGEKPFSCDICQYRCTRKSILESHIRTHTGENPFSCDICQYRCTQKSHLKSHMRTHTGEKPFSCDICQYRCIQKSNLDRHIRTQHRRKTVFM